MLAPSGVGKVKFPLAIVFARHVGPLVWRRWSFPWPSFLLVRLALWCQDGEVFPWPLFLSKLSSMISMGIYFYGRLIWLQKALHALGHLWALGVQWKVCVVVMWN